MLGQFGLPAAPWDRVSTGDVLFRQAREEGAVVRVNRGLIFINRKKIQTSARSARGIFSILDEQTDEDANRGASPIAWTTGPEILHRPSYGSGKISRFERTNCWTREL
jgi:hypothetical protein